ncbi:MAG: transporter [Cytophagales bacterium]|nr:transporter [Cytophagales bacterium]
MTDEEFDLLDELYFVKRFDELKAVLPWGTEKLKSEMWGLIVKEWIKCYLDLAEIDPPSPQEFEVNYSNYQYIATKKGLLAHNRS